MKTILWAVVTVMVFSVCFNKVSHAEVLDFEDIGWAGSNHGTWGGGSPNGFDYEGFYWDGDWGWISGSYPTGNWSGCVDGDYATYSQVFNQEYVISSVDGEAFTWNGADFGAPVASYGQWIAITGYNNTIPREYELVHLVDGEHNSLDVTWENIDSLTIANIDGSIFTMDNFTFNEDSNPSAPVPEPCTMLLFGTGVAGLAAVRKFKGKK